MSFRGYTGVMSTPKEALGNAIRKARKARGLRQEDVADRLDVNVRQVRRWEGGQHTPGGITLAGIVRYFRELADTPDLSALDAIVAMEVDKLSATDIDPDNRARALILVDRLIQHPHKFERWLSYGFGLLDADADTP